jgi:hypothetical protein
MEIHTIDLMKGSITIISDAEKGTITLQFDRVGDGLEPVKRILKAIGRRYGDGVMGRLSRWRSGESNPFVLASQSKPHPSNPDVLCFEIRIKPGERLESALGTLLGLLRQQPGYRRTFGSPLDRDHMLSRVQKVPSGDVSEAARDMMRRILKRPKK